MRCFPDPRVSSTRYLNATTRCPLIGEVSGEREAIAPETPAHCPSTGAIPSSA